MDLQRAAQELGTLVHAQEAVSAASSETPRVCKAAPPIVAHLQLDAPFIDRQPQCDRARLRVRRRIR
jgi:hypothetical protein